ncbi:MAG: hypothetical protein RSA62_03580 [Oscillospiraceae bacterium]
MADNKVNGYQITNKGTQTIQAPNKQPQDKVATALRGTDLRGGK